MAAVGAGVPSQAGPGRRDPRRSGIARGAGRRVVRAAARASGRRDRGAARPRPGLASPAEAPVGWPGLVDASVAPVIATRGLTKDYGSVLALDDLTLDIESGITGLVGANGAGKSTLIKILLGLVAAVPGDASVLGLHVADDAAAIRTRVGYLPEHDCLPPDVSASDFVVHMATDVRPAPRGGPRADRRGAASRRAGRGALPPDGRLLHRHEAARQARAGDRPRPAPGAPRRAHQRPRPRRARRHARPRAAGRPGLRHLGAGDLPPARRARAGQRPRRDPGQRSAAAGVGDPRLPPRDGHAARRGLGETVLGEDAQTRMGRALAAAGVPSSRAAGCWPSRPPRPTSASTCTTWCGTPRSTSGSAWSGSRPTTGASRTCSPTA